MVVYLKDGNLVLQNIDHLIFFREYISCRFQDVNMLKKELKFYEDKNKNGYSENSLREVKVTEKVAEEAVAEACRKIMDELKHAQ